MSKHRVYAASGASILALLSIGWNHELVPDKPIDWRQLQADAHAMLHPLMGDELIYIQTFPGKQFMALRAVTPPINLDASVSILSVENTESES